MSHDLVSELVIQQRADLLIITEPNKYLVARSGWMVVTNGDVAIMDVSGRIAWRLTSRSGGMWAVESDSTLAIGAYVSPNCDIHEFTRRLDIIQGVVNNARKKVIILGDFNSKAIAEGSAYTNRRGEILTDMMGAISCHCVNDGTPTYEARGHSSVLDLTIIDDRWSREHWDWRVLPHDVASDHHATMITLKGSDYVTREKMPYSSFTKEQIEIIIDRTAERIINIENLTPVALTNVIRQEMGRVAHRRANRHSVYWWNMEIETLKGLLQSRRRRKQRLRMRGGQEYEEASLAYKETRRALNKAIQIKLSCQGKAFYQQVANLHRRSGLKGNQKLKIRQKFE
ncbi:uncharacterized protein LOC142322605 [Lycorma delicatula]|uniref:uncharacterized protein LOC142322605 n=1 Tax=Lycorma delicatula TaxID=130591 RepID=UPI003F51637A